MNNTTRQHQRTLREAFRDADYSCAVERPRHESRWSVILGCALLGIGYAALLVYGWST